MSTWTDNNRSKTTKPTIVAIANSYNTLEIESMKRLTTSIAAFLVTVVLQHCSFLPTALAFTLQHTTTTTTPPRATSRATKFHHGPSSILVPRHSYQLYATTSTTNNNNNNDDADDADVYTIQILMSDTGGGHRASANALRDAFDVLYPGQIHCDIVDIYTDYGPFFPFNAVVEGYKIMAKYPILWDLFYHGGCTDFGMWLNEVITETFCFDAFAKCLARPTPNVKTQKRADMVISVHPLCQDLPLKILAHLDSQGQTRDVAARTTPFCTVVTDLGSAHPTWFYPGVDKCFVPSDALDKVAKQRGLQASQIIQYGLPIRKGFWGSDASHGGGIKLPSTMSTNKPKSKQELRELLGIDIDLPTALIVGGGDGMGGIVDIAKALGNTLGATSTPSSQMVVVCGNNQQAKETLQSVSWGPGVKVSVQGFVNNMDEWMRASDTLVTKAGPGTIAEASICGLPCMMFSYLPGQEAGNIPFVEDAGFGTYSGDPSVIAETVRSWLQSPETLQTMQTAALEAARPEATVDIARDLAEIVFATRKQQREGSLAAK